MLLPITGERVAKNGAKEKTKEPARPVARHRRERKIDEVPRPPRPVRRPLPPQRAEWPPQRHQDEVGLTFDLNRIKGDRVEVYVLSTFRYPEREMGSSSSGDRIAAHAVLMASIQHADARGPWLAVNAAV